ncbi:MAG: GNAT family N-acetyltransferase, partial [Bradyrhizobium sp.]
PLSRFVCLAVEALGVDLPDDTALVFASGSGCLHADRLFEESRHSVIRPALFPYTLPSACLAELAIRHKTMGPTICLAVAPGDEEEPMAEAHRGRGLGKALLVYLARECVDNGWSRLQWAVLDWNAPSIAFYKSLGAVMMDDWTLCRVAGPALTRLAGSSP